MVRDPEDFSCMTLDVMLKNGEKFNNVDTTSRPFGESGNMLAFWYENNVRMYPMDQVMCVVMKFDEDDNEEK